MVNNLGAMMICITMPLKVTFKRRTLHKRGKGAETFVWVRRLNFFVFLNCSFFWINQSMFCMVSCLFCDSRTYRVRGNRVTDL
jgi:hypothetical protein